MKKLIIVVLGLISFNSFAANSCQVNGATIQSGGTGCDSGSQVNCNNGVVTYSSDANGNAISCNGGVNVPASGAAAGNVIAPKKKVVR